MLLPVTKHYTPMSIDPPVLDLYPHGLACTLLARLLVRSLAATRFPGTTLCGCWYEEPRSFGPF